MEIMLGSDCTPNQVDAICEAFGGESFKNYLKEQAEWRKKKDQEYEEKWGRQFREADRKNKIKEQERIEKLQATGLYELIPDLLVSDNDYTHWFEVQYMSNVIFNALIKYKNQPDKIKAIKSNKYYSRYLQTRINNRKRIGSIF